MQDLIDARDDWSFQTHFRHPFERALAGEDSLGHLWPSQHLGQRFTFSKSITHAAIAAMRTEAGGDQVSNTCQTREGGGFSAMRHAELLGAREPLMWKLVPTLVREMGQAYAELPRAEKLISETLKLEETRFRKTLERGLAILDDETKALKQGDSLKGETAFTLYDTYGFPLDLTQDALRPRARRTRTRRRPDRSPSSCRATSPRARRAAASSGFFAHPS